MTTTHAATHRELVADAVRAPSSHNTQPWVFVASDDAIELYADRTRTLPVNDPHDRELTINCAAALFTLRVSAWAMASRGQRMMRRSSRRCPPAAPAERSSCRRRCRPRFATASAMRPATEGAWLETIDDGERRAELSDLVAEGDRAHFAHPRRRRELSSWMHPRRLGDGLSPSILALPLTRLVVSAFDLGRSTGAKDAGLVWGPPLLAVVRDPIQRSPRSQGEPHDLVSATGLDVRQMAPRDRHPTILSTFGALSAGQALELVNDHDPEHPRAGGGGLEEESGAWRVRIGRR